MVVGFLDKDTRRRGGSRRSLPPQKETGLVMTAGGYAITGGLVLSGIFVAELVAANSDDYAYVLKFNTAGIVVWGFLLLLFGVFLCRKSIF